MRTLVSRSWYKWEAKSYFRANLYKSGAKNIEAATLLVTICLRGFMVTFQRSNKNGKRTLAQEVLYDMERSKASREYEWSLKLTVQKVYSLLLFPNRNWLTCKGLRKSKKREKNIKILTRWYKFKAIQISQNLVSMS